MTALTSFGNNNGTIAISADTGIPETPSHTNINGSRSSTPIATPSKNDSNDSDNTSKSKKLAPHWSYYVVGFLSAMIMGTSAFVISLNFMLGQVPLLIVIACATAGMLLNTLLYWKDSAQKLSEFIQNIQSNPAKLLHKESLISFASALCVGFLALKSYIDQFSLLNPTSLKLIPYWTLSVLFSIANAISTFVLFYETPSTNTKSFTKDSMWSKIKNQLKKPFSHNLSNLIAITQSSMYSLTNLFCMQQVLTLLIPSAPVLTLVISTIFALALLFAECAFNCDKMIKLNQANTPSHWNQSPRLQMLLYTLIILNGFANGWIALGDLRHLSKILQVVIVGIGSLVSFAVMRDAVGDINNLIFKTTQNSHRFVPNNREDLKSVVSAIGKLFIFAIGFYFIGFPDVFRHIFSHFPFVASAMLSSFLYTAVFTAKDAYEYYQPAFRNFSVWSSSNAPNVAKKAQPANHLRSGFSIFGLFSRSNPNNRPAETRNAAFRN